MGNCQKKSRQLRQKCRTADTVEIFNMSTLLLPCLKWSYIVENTHPFRHWLDSQPKCLNDFLTDQRRLKTNRQFEHASTFEVLRLVDNKPDQRAKEGLDTFEEVDSVKFTVRKTGLGLYYICNTICLTNRSSGIFTRSKRTHTGLHFNKSSTGATSNLASITSSSGISFAFCKKTNLVPNQY